MTAVGEGTPLGRDVPMTREELRDLLDETIRGHSRRDTSDWDINLAMSAVEEHVALRLNEQASSDLSLPDRTRRHYRVEGWDADSWNMLSGAKDTTPEAELRMEQLKARFPEMPMRVVAETTSFMVVSCGPHRDRPHRLMEID